MSWLGDTKIVQSYRTLGPGKFGSLMVALFAWIGVGAWLAMSLRWPDAYGFHCHGRGCFVEDLWYSPRLIAPGHRTLMEIGLFAWEWSLPGIPLGALAWSLMKKRPKLTIFASDRTE
jgi:hypothetical protein